MLISLSLASFLFAIIYHISITSLYIDIGNSCLSLNLVHTFVVKATPTCQITPISHLVKFSELFLGIFLSQKSALIR